MWKNRRGVQRIQVTIVSETKERETFEMEGQIKDFLETMDMDVSHAMIEGYKNE
jgi:hypothetical protein